jgi:predicted metalloprotease with PDZ domain
VATQLPQFVRDIAAHEFLHIVTPLNIHSEQIHNFNYIEPEMSKHLWLYEGVTEYSAMHVQVREGLYDTEDFLAAIQGKIESAKEFPLVSFTEMSERILEPDFEAMYGNVYEKGALIALCLDLYLIKYSNGNIDLPTLLHDLANDYGPNKAFDDASFVETLTQLTYPEVGNFLNKYVVGDQPLPIDECLLWAGVAFQAPDTIMVVSFGNVSLDMNQDNLIIIANINAMDEFGTELDYQKGDILHSVNGQEVTLGNITMILDEFQKKTKEGEKVKIEVIRNVNEKVKVVKLKAKAITFPSISNELLIFIDNPAESQKLIRSAWISGINK